MPTTDIVVVRQGEAPAWPELDRGQILHLPDSVWRVALIEGGMASGAPSVALRLDLPVPVTIDQPPVHLIAETSIASLISTVLMARGAFPRAFVDTPLAEEREYVHVAWLDGDGALRTLEEFPANPQEAIDAGWIPLSRPRLARDGL